MKGNGQIRVLKVVFYFNLIVKSLLSINYCLQGKFIVIFSFYSLIITIATTSVISVSNSNFFIALFDGLSFACR